MDGQTNVVFDAHPKVPLTEFFPELSLEFQELPEQAMGHFVLRAINRLARDSNVLRREAHIITQDCVENYILEPDDCMDIVAIMGICQEQGSCCGEVSRLTNEPCRLPCGTWSWFEAPNTIWFSKPRCNHRYKVLMSVAPRYDACEVDACLLYEYYDTVLAGAKSYLYAMGNMPWSSLERMQYFDMRFVQGIRGAGVQRMMGGQRGALRAKQRRIL